MRRLRAWNADQDGLSPDDWREIIWGERCHHRLMRWRALKALWLPPVRQRPRDTRKGWTIYDGFERCRDEEWTLWRGLCATIGVIFDISPRLDPATGDFIGRFESVDIAYWDAGATYGGYTVEILQLLPGCSVSLFNDGETCL